MIKTAIVGATGYTGSELVRVLMNHPEVNIELITSESKSGRKFSEVHPQFHGICDMELQSADDLANYELDLCFLALPHRVSMEYVKRWKNKDFKIIDLSGDFRLSDAQVYEHWYGKAHVIPEMIKKAVYGLPEINKSEIKKSNLVANPGCYPTASALALAPLSDLDLLDATSIIIDAKSGTTGAGIKLSETTHFSNANENIKAYGLKSHRHTVEIEETLGQLSGHDLKVQFTPHLLPVDRGILATAYATPKRGISEIELQGIYAEFYKDCPFIRIRREVPELKYVRGTNLCDIFVTYDERTNRIIALSAIDNLMKGASGAAVQNMNLMFDIEETCGLNHIPPKP